MLYGTHFYRTTLQPGVPGLWNTHFVIIHVFGTCSCSCLQPDAHSIADIWDRGPGKLQKTTSQTPNPEILTQCSFIYIYICAQLPFETTSKLPGHQEPSALLCLQPSAGRQLPAPRSVVLSFFPAAQKKLCVV